MLWYKKRAIDMYVGICNDDDEKAKSGLGRFFFTHLSPNQLTTSRDLAGQESGNILLFLPLRCHSTTIHLPDYHATLFRQGGKRGESHPGGKLRRKKNGGAKKKNPTFSFQDVGRMVTKIVREKNCHNFLYYPGTKVEKYWHLLQYF